MTAERGTERFLIYAPSVRQKAEQLGAHVHTMRGMESLLDKLKPGEATELSKVLHEHSAPTKMYFTPSNAGGMKKILRALVDDLIDMGAPEVAGPLFRFYKYGEEDPLTEEQENNVKRLLEGPPAGQGELKAPDEIGISNIDTAIGIAEWQDGDTK